MRPPLVAIVDDDPETLILVRRAMSHQAPDVGLVEVRTSRELEQLLGSRTPDVVLLDFNLPDRDGLAVLRDLRKRGFDGAVVFLTGAGSEKIAVEAMKRGATDYVVKTPGYDVHLPRAVSTVLERLRLDREMAEESRRSDVDPAALAARSKAPLERSLAELGALAEAVGSLGEGDTIDGIELRLGRVRSDLEGLLKAFERIADRRGDVRR